MPTKAKPRDFGAIRKLPSGNHQASYVDNDGERVNAPRTFPTKKDAAEWLSTVHSDIIRGIIGKPTKKIPTLAYYGNEWIENHPRLKPNSLSQYRRTFAELIAPSLGTLKLTDLDTMTVRKWHADLGRKLQASKRTQALGSTGASRQASAYRLLRAILNTAIEDEFIEVNPCRIRGANVPPKQREEEQVLSPQQITELANLVEARYRAMVLVSAYGTLRHAELIGLQRRDIDLSEGTVTVRWNLNRVDGAWVRAKPKSKAGERTVYLPPTVVQALRDHLAKFVEASETASVFTTRTVKPVSRYGFGLMLKRAGKKIGRPDVFPHLLRHSALTLTAQVGATSKELMARGGHTTMKVALIYQHTVVEREREIAAKLDALGVVA